MSQQEQLERARQQLAEVQQRIEEQNITEEMWQQAQAQKQVMDEQMRQASGQFGFQTEQEYYLVTKLRLEEEVAALEAAIEAEHPPVEAEAVAREIQEPPAEPVVEKVGLFSRIGAWFRRHFSSQPAGENPAPVQEPRLTRRQRNAKLAQADKDMARWKQDAQQRGALAGALREQRPEGYLMPQLPRVNEPTPYDELMNRFLAAGWRNLKGHREGDTLPPWTEAQQRSELQQFLRELNNANLLDHANPGDILQLNVSEFSKASILEILQNRSPEAVERFIQPLLDFDPQAYARRFPLHKMTEQQRIARSQEIHQATHPLSAIIQWAEKFGEHVMTPELKKRYLEAAQAFNVTSYWSSMRITPAPYSFDEIYQTDVRQIDRLVSYTAHEEELKAVNRQVNEELCAGREMTRITDRDLRAWGLTTPERKFLARLNSSDAVEFSCHIPEETFRRANSGDGELARELIAQVERFSLITEQGRPRLCGDEPVDQLLRHGREDIAYYAEASEAATLLKMFVKSSRGQLAGLGYDTPEKVQKLLHAAQQAQNAYLALAKLRFADPNRSFSYQRTARNDDLPDDNWFLRKQNAELDAFERRQ